MREELIIESRGANRSTLNHEGIVCVDSELSFTIMEKLKQSSICLHRLYQGTNTQSKNYYLKNLWKGLF